MNKRELRKFRDDYTSWDGPCLTEGVRLAVHFDEKDQVKRIGARWQPDPSGKGGYWWMPCKTVHQPMIDGLPAIINTFEIAGDIGDASDASADGQSRLEWLNNNKMVNGYHGKVINDAALEAIADETAVEYHISNTETDDYGHFYVFENVGIANWAPNGQNPNYNHSLMTLESAYVLWDELMAQGYRLVVSENSEVSA